MYYNLEKEDAVQEALMRIEDDFPSATLATLIEGKDYWGIRQIIGKIIFPIIPILGENEEYNEEDGFINIPELELEYGDFNGMFTNEMFYLRKQLEYEYENDDGNLYSFVGNYWNNIFDEEIIARLNKKDYDIESLKIYLEYAEKHSNINMVNRVKEAIENVEL